MSETPAPAPAPDWRDEQAYAELERLDRRGFAWEYLRRNPDYAKQRKTGSQAAARLVAGITVMDVPPLSISPTWGLRFRGVAEHQRIFGSSLLG